jgi:Fur family transcriptional regulator, ferric uptake regulator
MKTKDDIRMTRKREVIFDILKEKGHLDAYELLQLARLKNPRISLSTVYRALSYFKKKAVIIDRTFGESHSHFEVLDDEAGSHAHFICNACGSVAEIPENFIEDMKKAARKRGCTISGTHVDIFGLCPVCKRKSK